MQEAVPRPELKRVPRPDLAEALWQGEWVRQGLSSLLTCCISRADVSPDAAAARGSGSQRRAEDGVAAEGPGAGPRRAQVPVRE